MNFSQLGGRSSQSQTFCFNLKLTLKSPYSQPKITNPRGEGGGGIWICSPNNPIFVHGGSRRCIPHICHIVHMWDMWRKICHVEKFQISIHGKWEDGRSWASGNLLNKTRITQSCSRHMQLNQLVLQCWGSQRWDIAVVANHRAWIIGGFTPTFRQNGVIRVCFAHFPLKDGFSH